FLCNDPPTTAIYTLSLHDALPISNSGCRASSMSADLLFQADQAVRHALRVHLVGAIGNRLADPFNALGVDRRTLVAGGADRAGRDRKSTRLNSSHVKISYAVFCLK